jgi:opacity protein-like surface antigen
MTKKTTTICCAVALLATTAANPALSQIKNFEGVSLSIGGTAISTQTNTNISDSDANYGSADFGKAKNFIPSIDLSYSAALSDKFLLGFGGRYDLAKNKSGNLSSDLTTSDVLNGAVEGGADDEDLIYTLSDIRNIESYNISYKDHASLYVMPTYLVNNSTGIFAKVGYHQQKGSLNYKNTQTVTDTENTVSELGAGGEGDVPTEYFSDTFTASGSRNFKGWGYGVGLKTLLTNNLFLQVEAEYIDYKSQSVTGTDDLVYKFKPESLSGTISIGYKF